MTLYEIDAEIRQFIDTLMESVNEDGEVVDIDPNRLEELQKAREDKLENIALYIKNLAAEADAIKKEETTLESRRKATERKIERLKGLLSASLIGSGDKEFKTARCAVTFIKSTSVEIIDESLIEKQYMKEEIKSKPDKTLIKKALKNGEEVRGAYLRDNQNIQIN